jgi:hypothetical protein
MKQNQEEKALHAIVVRLGLQEFVNLEPRTSDERESACRLNYGLKRLDFD